MATLRAFIAIELSTEAKLALATLQNGLKAKVPPQTVRWIAPESIHLTLHFLGDIAADEVDNFGQAITLAASASPSFSLTLGGLGCFPNMRRPRIVWTGVLGETNTLIRLQQDLGERLKPLGFTPETRPYSPHLTIGRVKDRLPTQQLTQLGQALEREGAKVGQLASFNVVEISLMQSELKPGGPVYTQLRAAQLSNLECGL